MSIAKATADYEGFLLLHGVGRYADPVYFELADGLLQYFTKKNGLFLGRVLLTRHRVTVRTVRNPKCPHQFVVTLCPVRSVHDTEREFDHLKRVSLILSASSSKVMEAWMDAFYLWRRRNWHDGVVLADHDDEFSVLRMVMFQHRLEPLLTREVNRVSMIRNVEVTPEMDIAQTKCSAVSTTSNNATTSTQSRTPMITPRTRQALAKLRQWAMPRSTKSAAVAC